MARQIRLGEHQFKVLTMLKNSGVWKKDAPDWDHLGAWRTEKLLDSLVVRGLALKTDNGTYMPAVNAPNFIVSTALSNPRKHRRPSTSRPSKPMTPITPRKLAPTELAAALPTNLLVTELKRRGYNVDRVSVLDTMVDWDR